MQVCSPLANMGNFSPSPENKALRARTLLGLAEDRNVLKLIMIMIVGRMENVCNSIREEGEKLRQAVRGAHFEEISKASRTISDRIHQLSGHCNINLVNDALRNWQGALKEAGSSELNAVSWLISPVDCG